MSGNETFVKVKQINPSLRVLLCSGYSIDGQAREILNCGCDGFIQKPYTLEQLGEKVNSILSAGSRVNIAS
jgi:DNA-binding NarL/FixJ family response regulator